MKDRTLSKIPQSSCVTAGMLWCPGVRLLRPQLRVPYVFIHRHLGMAVAMKIFIATIFVPNHTSSPRTGGRGWGSAFSGRGGGWGSTFGRGGGGGLGFGGNRMGRGAGWGSNGWASHAGSAGLGYWLGSRGRAAAGPTVPNGAQFQPGTNANNTWSSGSSSRAESTEKSTGYATTKRR